MKMDVEVGSWCERSEDEWFCLKLSWNVIRNLILSQISMLTACELNAGVNGTHELFMLGKLCCPIKHRNHGEMDGRNLLQSDQVDCSWCGMGPMTAMASVASIASMASMATMAHAAQMAPMTSVAAMERWC